MFDILILVLVLAGCVIGPVALMFLVYRRMIAIRDGSQTRLETDPDPTPGYTPIAQYTDAEVGADGLTYGRSMTFDPNLASADKRAAELPDINQTLQGRR